ncbi:MAG TPA: alpha/beta hydrolase [Thermoplasmata archaeon]|nr:alpha/beta hydrolase [Thermoplasmata archaeon]
MPIVARNEVHLFYETYSRSGDPTVLVHGSWADHASWARLVPSLSEALALTAYDRRGHGASRGPVRDRPVRDDAGDLALLLESIDLFPAHVIGHSYGGAVALRLAIDRPELVRSVALHEPLFVGLLDDGDATDRATAHAARSEIQRLRATARAGDAEGAARAFARWLSPESGPWGPADPGSRARFVERAERSVEEYGDPEATAPSRAELGALDLPVLLTTGELSLALFHRIQRELSHVLRNATTRTLPETGHVPHLTDPAVYAGALVTFLLERDVPST